MFATKVAQTHAMLHRAHAAGVRASFFTGDEVYSANVLRTTCRTLGLGYAVAVRTSHHLTLPSGAKLSAAKAKALVPKGAWQRMRTGTGSKGTRDYDWAMVDVRSDDTPADQAEGGGVGTVLDRPLHRHRVLLPLLEPGTGEPGAAGGHRVPALEDRERLPSCEEYRRDKGQVTTWRCWNRWSTAALVAYAFLAVATAHEAAETTPAGLELVPLSRFELLRLLRLLILPAPCRDAGHVLHWSAWRRCQQRRARACRQRWHAHADRPMNPKITIYSCRDRRLIIKNLKSPGMRPDSHHRTRMRRSILYTLDRSNVSRTMPYQRSANRVTLDTRSLARAGSADECHINSERGDRVPVGHN